MRNDPQTLGKTGSKKASSAQRDPVLDHPDHRVATVKGGEITGSATAEVRPTGRGGSLTVTGKDDHGHPLELTVECERFDEVVAEGG